MAININPAHRGMLHEALNIAKSKKIPGARLKSAISGAKKSGNTKLEREAVFAANAKKWHHK